jgi:hypothetical protein
MSHHSSLAKEARQSYLEGRYAESALVYRRAAAAALDIGDRAAWFGHTSWAASATKNLGDLPSALALFLAARQAEPEDAPQFEAWMARKDLIDITLATHPEVTRLESLFGDLRGYALTNHVCRGDIPYLEAEFRRMKGEWSAALNGCETAWREHDGSGYLKSKTAYTAAQCALQLGQRSVCADWIEAMSGCDQEFRTTPAIRSEMALKLAVAEGRDPHEVATKLRTYADAVVGIDEAVSVAALREVTARVHLLDSTNGDPAARRHPSRRELCRRCPRRYSVERRYGARVLLLDYRLACLRHAVGVPPVDDVYYTRFQRVPTHVVPSDAAVFARRLRKARAAAQWAMRYAEELDGMLRCNWRQQDVRARMTRIEQIAQAVGADAS